jgi:predicted ATP-dependent Lon-type protease
LHVAARIDFGGTTGRNQDAVKKTTAGLLKLIYPHRTVRTLAQDEFDRCFELAVECRKRVIDQLAIMQPREFRHVQWTFKRRSGLPEESV